MNPMVFVVEEYDGSSWYAVDHLAFTDQRIAEAARNAHRESHHRDRPSFVRVAVYEFAGEAEEG
jgi:hypothetical protein